jgi:hypothetical protein
MKSCSSQTKVKLKGACENKSEIYGSHPILFYLKPEVKSSSQTNPCLLPFLLSFFSTIDYWN